MLKYKKSSIDECRKNSLNQTKYNFVKPPYPLQCKVYRGFNFLYGLHVTYIDGQEFAVTVPNNTDTFVLTVTVGANVQSATVVNGKANMAGLTTGDIGTAKLYNLKDLNTVIASTNFVFKASVTKTVTFSVAAGAGTLTAKVDGVAIATTDAVKEGRNVVFTAAPTAGNRVKEWKVDGTVVAGEKSNSITVPVLLANRTVTVEFEAIPAYAMTFAQPANGALKASVDGTEIVTTNTVTEGKNVVFLAIPAATHKVKEWTVDGVVVAGQTGTTFTLANINAAKTVAVVLEALPAKTVTFSATPTNGALAAKVDGVAITSAPDATGTVLVGKDVVFTVTPDAGYRVKEWTVGGTVVAGQTANTFTVTNLTDNVTVAVVLELDI